MVAIDSTPTISIFGKNLRFFVQEKVYKIEVPKFYGFAPKSLHFEAINGSLQIEANTESDVFIDSKVVSDL